jgi:hypothetical protein
MGLDMKAQAMAEPAAVLVPLLLATVLSVAAAAVALAALRPGVRPLQLATAAAQLALQPAPATTAALRAGP